MTLVPSETIERILLSSTSRFVADYQTDGLILTHAWPGFNSPSGSVRMQEGPLSRSAFMLSFVVPEVPKLPGMVIPNYEANGENICSLLSLLFGKRFDSHGSVESHGSFRLPHLDQFNSLCNSKLPQNSHVPRSDIAVPLDLRQVARIAPLITGNVPDIVKARTLYGAAKFYHQALQNAENEPEVAYLHLITAGEILANAHCPESPDYLDESVREILDKVRTGIPDGEKAAKTLASRMRQIKRRFVIALTDLVDDGFFSASTTAPDWARLKRDDFGRRVAAAYDVRSRYVHTGVSFGAWTDPAISGLDEVRGGRPVIDDGEFAKMLQLAPTYSGLERIIRFCLFRFAERQRLIVDPPTY
jgi:hypothetical protein